MSMNPIGIILVVILLLAIFGGLPSVGWYHSGPWLGGYGGSGLGTVLLILVILWLVGLF